MPNKFGFKLVPQDDGSLAIVCCQPETPLAVSPAGSRLRDVYRRVWDENHNNKIYVKEEKQIDSYARIQSYLDGCLIDNLIRRCQGGDMSALQQTRGFYGDFSKHISLAEAHQLDLKARGVFDALSEADKGRYNNDYKTFLHAVGTGEILEQFVRGTVTSDSVSAEVKEVANES